VNPGGAEEAGKVAHAIVGALKDNPAYLMILVLNLVFLAVLYIALTRVYDRTTAQLEKDDRMLLQALEKCGVK
jgi:hypothetical protein